MGGTPRFQSFNLKMRFIITLISVGSAAGSDLVSPELESEIHSGLRQVCGEDCVSTWESFKSSAPAETTFSEAVMKKMDDFSKQASFIRKSADDSCSYARVGALAASQAVNLGVHAMGVATKAACACIDVYTESKCLMKASPPPYPCSAMLGSFTGLMTAANVAWDAVKASTLACTSMGDRTAFLHRPQLNLHVGETSFLSAGQRLAEVEKLEGLLSAGNRAGLVGLLALMSNDEARVSMSKSGIAAKARTFANLPSTSDYDRELAGSLITGITGEPVAFQISDANTGGYGHTNVIVPSPSRR